MPEKALCRRRSKLSKRHGSRPRTVAPWSVGFVPSLVHEYTLGWRMSVEVGTVTGARRRPTSLYVYLSLIFILLAFGGFARTYLVPVVTDQFDGASILHIHGILFFAWTILFAVQAQLVGSGRVEPHRALGLIGISLATAMVFAAVALIVRGLNYGVATDNFFAASQLAVVPTTSITMFAVLFAAAVANIRRTETHKRLMVLATTTLLTAPMARVFLMFFAPRGDRPNFGATDAALVNTGLIGALVAALIVDLLIVAAIVHDWRTRGRPHRVYVIGGLFIVLVQVLRIPFAKTELWKSIAVGIAALGS